MPKPWEMPYSERFRDRLPRVHVGLVAFGDVYPEVLESAVHWAFQAGHRYKGQFEIFFAVATRQEQYRARNNLVTQAQQGGADFLLMLDDDHLLSDCPDMIGHFFREEKPMQGGLYATRQENGTRPVILKYAEGGGSCEWCRWDEIPRDGGPVDVLGGGCTWTDMTVFDFMHQPHWFPYPADRREVAFLPDESLGLDLQLSIGCRKLGIQPWLNGNVTLGHVAHERTTLRPPMFEGPVRCSVCEGLASYKAGKWHCLTPDCQAVLEAA